MTAALLLFAIPICIADVHAFVIPNIYTKILFYIALVHFIVFGFVQLEYAIVSIVVLICLLLFGAGMGDIKLLALIVFTHTLLVTEFLSFVFLWAMVHIVVLTGRHRKIPSKIPLAPSIFIAMATYLATR